MTLLGYSVPETLTNDTGKAQKGKTLAVTGPGGYTGVVVSDPTDGVFRLGPLPTGMYTVTYGDRSVDVPVFPTPADLQAGYDAAVGAAPSSSLTSEAAARASADSAESSARIAAVAAESAARSAADSADDTRDAAEAASRTAADAAEVAARAAADSAEAATRAAAVTDEATARAAAVTAEANRALAAEAALSASVAANTAALATKLAISTASATFAPLAAPALTGIPTLNGVPLSNEHAFDIRGFGGDLRGRWVSDAAMASGSTALTSATAAFTPGDVGKVVALATQVNPATSLAGTITAFNSATSVTLSVSNGTGSAISGAFLALGPDATPAFTAAHTAMAASPTGGLCFVPDGLYLIAGVQQSGTQIPIPIITTANPGKTIGFVGETPPQQVIWNLASTVTATMSGAILLSLQGVLAGVSTGSVFAATATTNLMYCLHRLTVRNLAGVGASQVYLANVNNCDLADLNIDVQASVPNITPPTGFSAIALQMPGLGNGAYCKARRVQVVGTQIAYGINEHSDMDYVTCYQVNVGMQTTYMNHAAHIGRFGAYWCNYAAFQETGGNNQHFVTCSQLDIEFHTANGTWDIYDPANVLYGTMNVHKVIAGTGPTTSLVISGAKNLQIRSVGLAGASAVKPPVNDTTGTAAAINAIGAALAARGVLPAYFPYASYSAAVLADSPAAFWPLKEASGTAATDSTANANNGTYTGTFTLGVAGPLLYGTDTAVNLAGTGYVTVPDALSLRLTSTFTLEAWVYPVDTSNNYWIIAKTAAGVARAYEWRLENTSGKPHLYTTAGSNVLATQAPPTGQWSHVAVVVSGGTATHYLNGVANGSGAVSTGTDAGGSVMVGTRNDLNSLFKGRMADAAIYPSALSAARILAHYQAQFN